MNLVHAGWDKVRRIHGSVIHIDIKNSRVWIQHDGIESGIVDELVEAGIPKDEVVLAFRSPGVKQHTRYAVS